MLLSAQAPTDLVKVEQYSIEQGLLNRDLTRGIVDKRGFVWFSSRGAISRFDGVSFKNYDWQFLGISPSSMVHLRRGPDGMLLLRAEQTLKLFNPETDKLFEFDAYFAGRCPFRADEVLKEVGYPEDYYNVFALKNNRLYVYEGGLFKPLSIPKGFSTSQAWFKVYLTQQYRIWYSDGQMLVEHVPTGKQEWVYDVPPPLTIYPAGSGGFFMVMDPYLVETRKNNGLIWEKHPGKPIKQKPLQQGGRPMPYLRRYYACLNLDGSGLYYGENNIKWFDAKGKIFREISLPPDRNTEKKPVVNHVMTLPQHGIFLVSTGEGVYKVSFTKQRFHNFLTGISIRGMCEVDGELLVNSYSSLQRFSLSAGTVTRVPLPEMIGMALTKLPDGRILSGVESCSMMMYEPKLGKNTTLPDTLCGWRSYIVPYYDEASHTIWVGSTGGLYRFDLASKMYTKVEAVGDIVIRQLVRKPDGLWIISESGLKRLNNDGKLETILTKKNGLPTDVLRYLHEDRDGIFWIATLGGGLVRWDRSKPIGDKNALKIYDNRTGFSNSHLYAVLEDRNGFLWLPSDYGLMRFNKVNGVVNIFMPRDGLPHEEFNYLAHQVLSDGRIAVGGLNGFSVFDPDDFKDAKDKEAPLYISQLKYYDGDSEQIRDITIQASLEKSVHFDVNDRFIELQFALLDYTAPFQNRFAYQIQGLDHDWVYLDGNELRLTDLPPGNYTLRVKAQGSGGQWSNSVIEIPISKSAPLHQRWQFWMLMAFLAGSLSYAFFKWRTRRLVQEREQLEAAVASRTATIRQQAEKLLQLDQAKNRFFENITHELRTPLTLILEPLRQLFRSSDTTFENPKIALAQNNAERLLDLVNQFLDLTKMESGHFKLHMIKGSITALLREVFVQFRPLAEQKGVLLTWQAPNADIHGFFDRNALERVAYNLLANALKFTHSGGEVAFHVKSDEHGENVEIMVADTGIGISQESLPHIFDRFYQSDNSRTRLFEGTGIGLALVKELVDMLRGSISVESSALGSVFTVVLPTTPPEGIVPTDDNQDMVGTSLPKITDLHLLPPPSDDADATLPTILLVEDNTDMRQYIAAILAEARYRVIQATDGDHGIRAAREHIPDIIVSDVMMPHKDGFEVLETLKKDLLTSHIPIILLTAKSKTGDNIEAYRLGADAYLPKPFDSTELLVRISQLLRMRGIMQQKFRQIQPDSTALHSTATQDAATFSALDADFLTRLHHIILESIPDPDTSAETLAGRFYMSRAQFFAKVKALTGEAPASMLRTRRLQKASELLLADPNARASDIATQVGYTDARGFYAAFKKQFGKTPSEFRAEKGITSHDE